jgi:hypothetical protein
MPIQSSVVIPEVIADRCNLDLSTSKPHPASSFESLQAMSSQSRDALVPLFLLNTVRAGADSDIGAASAPVAEDSADGMPPLIHFEWEGSDAGGAVAPVAEVDDVGSSDVSFFPLVLDDVDTSELLAASSLADWFQIASSPTLPVRYGGSAVPVLRDHVTMEEPMPLLGEEDEGSHEHTLEPFCGVGHRLYEHWQPFTGLARRLF